jgi:hypothetical protein
MVDYQDNFLVTNLADVESSYLRALIDEQDGKIDERLQSLMHLEKYLRGIRPSSARMFIQMLISGIVHAYPAETEIMRRELEGGPAMSPEERQAIENSRPKATEDHDVTITLHGGEQAKARLQDGALQLHRTPGTRPRGRDWRFTILKS